MSESLPGIVGSLDELVSTEASFSTVYADPPWSYSNKAARGAADNHYSTLELDAICSEPVDQLIADNAHLHLWTTNGFLREAFTVMDAWGFQFKSCLVWIKPQLGMGNYWRVSHELLCDRSHKYSYVVSLIMWWRPRVHLEIRNRANRLHHIIFRPRAAQSRVARVWFGGFVVHRLERRPNCAARRENYVAFPCPPTKQFKAFNATTPHNELDHIRISAPGRSRQPAVCGQDLPKLVATSANTSQPQTVRSSRTDRTSQSGAVPRTLRSRRATKNPMDRLRKPS